MINIYQILKLKSFIFLLYVIFALENCNNHKSKNFLFNNRIEQISSKYISDKSLEVFSANLQRKNGMWILNGETSNEHVYSSIKLFSDSLFGKMNYTNNFLMLPDSNLRDSLFAIINVSVTPIKEKPSHSSQIIDQGKMGNPLKILRFESGWYLCQTHYNYVGWVNSTAIQICNSNQIKNWNSQNLVSISIISGHIYTRPDIESSPISDIVLNNKIKLINKNEDWSLIQLPDKRFGYIQNNSFEELINNQTISPKYLLKTAYQMMGVPYLWGGNSSKGNDCSGFIQNIFEASNVKLPRDARQQALLGENIVPNKNWSNIKPGDLLFFGKNKRITHVGMSIGEYEFIHQGGMVAINSLDKESKIFAPKRFETFLFIKRINYLKQL